MKEVCSFLTYHFLQTKDPQCLVLCAHVCPLGIFANEKRSLTFNMNWTKFSGFFKKKVVEDNFVVRFFFKDLYKDTVLQFCETWTKHFPYEKILYMSCGFYIFNKYRYKFQFTWVLFLVLKIFCSQQNGKFRIGHWTCHWSVLTVSFSDWK